jgi:hypothetical protein
VPNHGTGKEKMNNSNKKSPTLASLLAWGKTLRNSCSEYEEHHYCFLFAAKLRGCCPNLWDRLQLFHFFLKKHLSRADQHVQVMCKVMKNEIVHLL